MPEEDRAAIAAIAQSLYKAKSALILDHALAGSKSVAKALAELHKISRALAELADR